jgi:DNA-binding MarR family transcriptional regulator
MASPRSAPCACARLRRAGRAVTRFYDDALAPAGLRVTQFAVLRMLARNGATTISALAQVMLLDRTALSRALDPLVARSLVAVAPGRDARTRDIALTAAGRRALAAGEPHWAIAQERVARRVGRERLDALYATLRELEALRPDAG